ncbi:PSD1 and planctomycete cytochrome C domain-containing protein [Roseivirga sp.]|uniref:PSD1 and planctomycete cytochrome C domain-containing protein n=1 Tax=Roseivirga sp. TaxID=1964215 RepID=UPI003B8CBE21
MLKSAKSKLDFRHVIIALILFTSLVVLKSCQKKAQNDSKNISEDEALTESAYIPEVVDFNIHVKPLLSDRCFACHGPDANKRDSGFRLDTEEGAYAALKDRTDVFGIVPGDVSQSEVIKRITSEDPDLMMPPPASNLALSETEKEILAKWVEQGAKWKKHWSFIPVVAQDLPDSNDWTQNEVDHWVAQKFEEKGFTPAKKASKERLLRRASFDLTGLPPSDDLRRSFLADNSEEAFEKAVDQLMGTPAYGEHMASAWLDLARYSDTHGYQDDLERIMWPWRDWVIKAFNENMSYKTFVTWQLAGDLLPNPSKEQILATAFNRNHKITQEGGVIQEEYRVEYVTDRVNTFGKAFMGLTLECAKCHDHKYDPISQKEFFSVYSFFNSIPEKGRIDYGEIPAPKIKITDKDLKGVLKFVNTKNFKGDDLSVMVMKDSVKPRPTFVLNRGQYDAQGERVYPTTPEAVNAFGNELSKDRMGLAKWLFDEKNPLTARVTVNRVWQAFFGTGLVNTPADFGNQGSLPSHPELLDYLAYEFMKSDWNMQALQKKILLSATYQQSSKVTPELLESDPENKWLTRGPRYRMSFEMIRDNVLAVSGLLNKEVGGPSVKPYQPEGLWAETTSGVGLTKYIPDDGDALYRRSLYTFWKRTVPPPAMITFDAASRDLCEVDRQKTNTPLQALVMMNDPQVLEASRVLAYNAIGQKESNTERIDYVFEKILGRSPSDEEQRILSEFLTEELSRFKASPENTEAYLNVGNYPQEIESAEAAAYMSVINTIFNLDEAISKT